MRNIFIRACLVVEDTVCLDLVMVTFLTADKFTVESPVAKYAFELVQGLNGRPAAMLFVQ